MPSIFQVQRPQGTRCRAENDADLRFTEGFFPYTYENFQRTPEEVWSKWEAAVPDEETKLLLAELDLPEALRWALLAESLRWAARGHDFLRTFAAQVHGVDLPKEPSAKFFQVSSVSAISSASGLIRLAVTALAEMLARSRQSVEKSELCALLWFLEFTLSEQARDEQQILGMHSSLNEVLQKERLDRLEPGDRGSDLPVCVGDVLTVIHDCCTALELECPWPKELDGHLDLMLFVNLVQAFEKEKSKWKPVAGSFKAARAAQNLRTLIWSLPLRMDTKKQQYRKICAAAETDRKMLSDTVLELGFKAPEADQHRDDIRRQEVLITREELEEDDEIDEDDEDDEDDVDDEENQDEEREEMEIQELEELEEMLEMTQNEDEQNDGTRKLSDVQMRRQARVDWKPEAVLQQISAEELSKAKKLSRAAMYMHHITAPWKQRFIKEAAKRAGLSGICVFGKPGRILVEGPLELVSRYTARVKSWPWKRCDLQGPWTVDGDRAFHGFREIKKADFKKEVAAAGLSEQLKGIRSE